MSTYLKRTKYVFCICYVDSNMDITNTDIFETIAKFNKSLLEITDEKYICEIRKQIWTYRKDYPSQKISEMNSWHQNTIYDSDDEFSIPKRLEKISDRMDKINSWYFEEQEEQEEKEEKEWITFYSIVAKKEVTLRIPVSFLNFWPTDHIREEDLLIIEAWAEMIRFQLLQNKDIGINRNRLNIILSRMRKYRYMDYMNHEMIRSKALRIRNLATPIANDYFYNFVREQQKQVCTFS